MQENERTRKRVLANMLWRFAERTGAQVVSFLVTLAIARILEPQAYGIVAIINAFTTILFVFVDSGLGSALIQKKDADNIDFSTVFFTNIVFCLLIYLCLYFVAPYIALFYSNHEMTSLIRVSGLIIPISAIKNVQQAYITKNMMFKNFFYATMGGTVGSAIVGIGMAVTGYGVWALVISGLFNNVIDTLVLWITVKWRPEKKFSFNRLKSLLSYGWKLLAASLFQNVYANMYQLVIGKIYTSKDLAFYDRGKTIPNLVISNIDDSINSVLLPVMSEQQDNKKSIRAVTKRALKVNIYIMTPVLVGIAAVSESLIILLLTDKWLGAAIYLKVFCLAQVFRPVATANLSAIKAVGRSDLFFKLEIWKDIIGISMLLCTMQQGVIGIAIGFGVSSFLCQIINAYPSKKLFEYGLGEQIRDIAPTIMVSVIMYIIVFPVKYIGLGNILTLFVQIILGIIVYIWGSKAFKVDTYSYILDLCKGWFNNIN